MPQLPQFSRPPFEQVLNAWTALLGERQLPTELAWIFDENLCFEKTAQDKGEVRPAFQTRFTPPPPEAEQIAYDYFCEFEARLVLYRIGTAGGKSICLLLCDEWFEPKGEKDGFIRHDDWLISFRPGGPEPIEEISDEQRWKQRLLRDRPLHDLDFCMTLRAVHEALAHGRVLTTYEHYALRFMNVWRRLLTRPE